MHICCCPEKNFKKLKMLRIDKLNPRAIGTIPEDSGGHSKASVLPNKNNTGRLDFQSDYLFRQSRLDSYRF